MSDTKHTVHVERYQQAGDSAGENSYKGLRIHALAGLHAFLGQLATDHLIAGARVLDMAAGTGAMSMRLRDLGFDVHATDYVTENFRASGVPFVQADLNSDFGHAYGTPFSAIMASEIIEHLENPRHFARQCANVLEADGKVILSTPNIQNAGSMASFVRSGRFLWFDDQEYAQQGHITPLTPWQIQCAFVEAGFRPVWSGSFGEGASRLGGSPRLAILAKLLSAASALPESQSGEIYAAVFCKKTSGRDTAP